MIELDEEQKERLSEFVSGLENHLASYGFSLVFKGGELFDTIKGVSLPCSMRSCSCFNDNLVSYFVLESGGL